MMRNQLLSDMRNTVNIFINLFTTSRKKTVRCDLDTQMTLIVRRGRRGERQSQEGGELMEKKILRVLSCEVPNELKLDKGAAMRLINGEPINFARVHATFTFMDTDEKGRLYRILPLWMVPFHWMRGLFRRLPGGGNWLWDRYPGMPVTKTVDDLIQSFSIGVIKEDQK